MTKPVVTVDYNPREVEQVARTFANALDVLPEKQARTSTLYETLQAMAAVDGARQYMPDYVLQLLARLEGAATE